MNATARLDTCARLSRSRVGPAMPAGGFSMTEQASKLPRKPFGYDPTVVDQMMSDRDAMLSLAERRVRDAEAKVAHLEHQLAAQQQAVAELSERLAAAELAPPPPAAPL